MPSTLSLIHHMFSDPRQRTTAMGVWVMSLSLGTVVFGIKRMAEVGTGWTTVTGIAAGSTVGGGLLRRQARLDVPLIDLWLFRAPAFSAALATNALTFFVLLGTHLAMTQFLQLVLDKSPLEAGLWLLPIPPGWWPGPSLPRPSPAASARATSSQAGSWWPRSS
jgi:MFS transporter, DHA2 family, multidrug resistance protein